MRRWRSGGFQASGHGRVAVLLIWVTATLVLGATAWLGLDRLSPHVLDTGEVSQALSGDGATWRIVCAAGEDPVANRDTGGWWQRLETIDAVEATDAVTRCYQARWTGGVVPVTGIGDEDAGGRVQPEASPAAATLVSPDAFTAWSANPVDGWSFADRAGAVRADILRAERVALPLTLVVLLLVTRSFRRAVIPLVTGGVVAICATGLLVALTMVQTVPTLVLTFVTMLSLALGMDYALLWIIQGSRERPSLLDRLADSSAHPQAVMLSAAKHPRAKHCPPQADAVETSPASAYGRLRFARGPFHPLSDSPPTRGREPSLRVTGWGGVRTPSAGKEGERPGRHGVATTIRLAGTVVIGASLGLLVMPLGVFRVVLLATVFVVLVAVLAATSLVPALVGDGQRRLPPSADGGGAPREAGKSRADTSSAALRGIRVRGAIAVCALAILVALGWQAMDLQTGISIQLTPPVDATGTYDAYLQQNMVEVRLSSVDITFPTAASAEALPDILRFIGEDEDFAPVVLVDSPDGAAVRSLRAVVVRPADSDQAVQAIERLHAHIRSLDVETGPEIGGPLVTYERVVNSITTRQVGAALLSLAVAGLVMIALVGMPFVSLVALVGSVLSFSAAMGVLVLVFQRGMLANPAGVDSVPFIEAWVPIVVFCVLLGMGIDYHLFVLGGTREARANGVFGPAAIDVGVRAVRPVIIAASIAMMLVFGGFVLSESHGLQQLGVGLAVGIALDALIVRLWLVPVGLSVVRKVGATPASVARRVS